MSRTKDICYCNCCTFNLDDISLGSSSYVRNLSVIFDEDLSFNSYETGHKVNFL